jgi:Tol biopolymer transport system component
MRTIRPEHGLIACALLALSACGDGEDGITNPTTGSAQVTIATTGRVLDRDGYTVSVDGHADAAVPANHTLTLSGLAPGPHTVRFGGVAENCAVAGGTTRTVEVTAGREAAVQFSVQCTGNRFAYVETVNNISSVYVRRLDGTGLTRIATGTLSSRVDWSPDGHRLVFAAPGTVQGSRNLHVFDVDSGTTRTVPLPDLPVAVHPAWSPDGTRLVFSGIPVDGVRTIYTVRPDGTELRRLTPDPAGETMPVWSPDGTRIAYRRDTPTTSEVWVMRADGTSPQRLAALGSVGYTHIDWSPDGSRIVFNGFRDGNWELITVRPDGSGETRLTTTPTVDERYATFLPDGRIGYNAMPAGTIPVQDAWIINADGTGATQFTSTPTVSESVPAWQ